MFNKSQNIIHMILFLQCVPAHRLPTNLWWGFGNVKITITISIYNNHHRWGVDLGPRGVRKGPKETPPPAQRNLIIGFQAFGRPVPLIWVCVGCIFVMMAFPHYWQSFIFFLVELCRLRHFIFVIYFLNRGFLNRGRGVRPPAGSIWTRPLNGAQFLWKQSIWRSWVLSAMRHLWIPWMHSKTTHWSAKLN